MTFQFQCPVCLEVVNVRGRIGHPPKAPTHCGHKARRVYSGLQFAIQWGWADYANRAYDGDEQVPGYTTQEVRKTVDSMKVRSS